MARSAEVALPPGPRLPRSLQTLAFLVAPVRYIEACRRRYGDVVTFGSLVDPRFVMVFDPELVKQVFRAPAELLRTGESNAAFAAVVGERSVLVMDGAEHMRRRRLLLPHFHGARMRAHEAMIRGAADRQIDSWPTGRPFALLPSMRSLTFDVILRAVFGIDEGPRQEEIKRRVRAMIDPVTTPLGVLASALSGRRLGRGARERVAERRRLADELIYEELARRRAAPDLEQREDVLSMLLVARDDDGAAMSDEEVRDEVVTVLLAGHETTAAALAWTFELLLSHPPVLERLRAKLAEGDRGYLDAVIKEALRARPPVASVGRVVREQPYALRGYLVPPGTEINASIVGIHRRADRYPDPHAFRPERFLGSDPPDIYTWLPFGGGTRRCLGANFASFEMGIVIPRVLERARLEPAGSPVRRLRRPPTHVVNLDRGMRRGIFFVPKRGVRVIQTRTPLPAPACSGRERAVSGSVPALRRGDPDRTTRLRA